MKNNRFNELIAKYKVDNLSREEYQEFLEMLGKPEAVELLDKVLNQYWQETGSALIKNYSEIPEKRKFGPRMKLLLWGVAASFALVCGLFIFIQGMPELFQGHEVVYQTGYGEREEFILDDGSTITLNANSTLRWTKNWREIQSREIILEGEAFFEVENQNDVPFTVNTNDVAVEVLGTSFNVDSRKAKTEVYLEEGKVNLKLKREEDPRSVAKSQEILMKPGDHVRYSSLEDQVERVEGQTIIMAASWKNNVLNFKNMIFSDVLDLLREIYGQSFECSNSKLLNTPMYLGVPYSDWNAVRQALELSLNIEFKKTANRRYVVINTN